MSESILSSWALESGVWRHYIRSICESEVGTFWMKTDYYFGYDLSAEDEAEIDEVVIKVSRPPWPGVKFEGRYKKAGGDWITFLIDHELTFEDDSCAHGLEKKVTLPGPGSGVTFRGKFKLEYILTDLGSPPYGYSALPVPLVVEDIPSTDIYGVVRTDEGVKGRLRHDYGVCSPPATRCVDSWLYECVAGKWSLKAKACVPPTPPPETTLTSRDATTEERTPVELSATLEDEDGNLLADETVTFTLTRKSYSNTTGAGGVVTVTVPAADVPSVGDYTWTAEYGGNGYKKSSCSGSLTVTVAPLCTEGETKCIGYDLYECKTGKWELKGVGSEVCGAPSECTEGETKCIGYNLYECKTGKWELKEVNSRSCGYTPPLPCPIACVCMGTPLIDNLGPIREFRDKTLKFTRAGKKFVDVYYDQLTPFLSPVLMKSLSLRKAGREVVKGILYFLKK